MSAVDPAPSPLEWLAGLPALPSVPPQTWKEVEAATERLLEHIRSPNLSEPYLESAFQYGCLLYDRGDETGAEEIFEALDRHPAVACRNDVRAYCALWLVRCHAEADEMEEALDRLRGARALCRALPPSHPAHGACAAAHGAIESGRGRYDHAARAYGLSAALCPADSKLTALWDRSPAGDVAALRSLTAAEAILQGLRDGGSGGGELDRAEREIRAAQALSNSLRVRLTCQIHLAELALGRGRPDSASTLAHGILGLLRDPGFSAPLSRGLLPEVHWLLARIEFFRGDLSGALDHLRAAFSALRHWRRTSSERRLVEDLVHMLGHLHTQRHGGFREQSILDDLDREGAWIPALAEQSEARDRYILSGHSRHVETLCLALIETDGSRHPRAPFAPGEVVSGPLRGAALLHDIGKLRVSWSLLCRHRTPLPKHLTRIARHVQEGVRLVEILGLPWTARIVGEHHERLGGRGYPLGAETLSSMGSILALSEAVVSAASPSFRVPRPPSLEATVRSLLSDPEPEFPAPALDALRGASSRGALHPLGQALRADLAPGPLSRAQQLDRTRG
ncbi:MAG: HD domain-containing protein [Acidobacteriota bacterium]